MHDFEEIKHSEANPELQRVEMSIANAVDVGMDSYYPLMTNNPEKKREYTLKITNNHLENVMGQKNSNLFNLQSIYIQDNYMAPKQNK